MAVEDGLPEAGDVEGAGEGPGVRGDGPGDVGAGGDARAEEPGDAGGDSPARAPATAADDARSAEHVGSGQHAGSDHKPADVDPGRGDGEEARPCGQLFIV